MLKDTMSRNNPKANRGGKIQIVMHNPDDLEHLKVCKSCSATEFYQRPLSETVIVASEPEKFEEAVAEIKAARPTVLGLDSKTQQGSKMISVITLVLPGGKSYIFPIRKIWNDFRELPPGIVKLLQTPHIIKLMFDPVRRGEELSGYKVRMDGYIDIRSVARMRGFEKTGVDSLAAELFKSAYKRHPHWRKRKYFMQAKWDEAVSSDMAEYTASRANLTIVIYDGLCQLPLMPYMPAVPAVVPAAVVPASVASDTPPEE